MFIELKDVVNECIKYVNIKYITSINTIRTGETFVEYVDGYLYTDIKPKDLVLEIERINNEENK